MVLAVFQDISYNFHMNTYVKYQTSYIEQSSSLPFHEEQYTYQAPCLGGLHSHEFFEIGIILEGSGTHYFPDASCPLSAGDVYLVPIGTLHALENTAPMVIQNLYLLPKSALDSLNIPREAFDLFLDFFFTCIMKNPGEVYHFHLDTDGMQAIQNQIQAYQHTGCLMDTLGQAVRKNIFTNLLLLLCDSWAGSRLPDTAKKDFRILRILRILYDRIALPTGQIIQETAEILHLNPQYLNRLVKQAFHCTISQLILEIKLEKSCQLLDLDHSITDTALLLSFYDHSHFTRYFTKYFGISPSVYRNRKKHKADEISHFA